MTDQAWKDIAVGQRVRIMGGHPWAGHCATVTAVEQIRGRGLLYPKVAVDEGPGVPKGGHPSFVVHPSQAELIPA
ncbi:MAG: hypothetical protein ABSB88_06140 [Bryobacteraceae bacterium]